MLWVIMTLFLKKKYIIPTQDNSYTIIPNILSFILKGLVPADKKQKALTDFGTLEFEDKCPVYRWKWDSAINPLDISFKMDEEMEYFDRFINENTKIISSQSGNKLVTTSKNSYGTWVTTSTFTDSFCIMVTFYFTFLRMKL